MSNETKQMGAEEFYQDCAFLVPYPKGRNIAVVTVDDAYEKIQEQTAGLREELERSKERVDYYRAAADRKDVVIEEVSKQCGKHYEEAVRQGCEAGRLAAELEAVKKERDTLKGLCWTLAALSHVTGEVVDGYRVREVVLEMRRLSSGETKPSESANTKPE